MKPLEFKLHIKVDQSSIQPVLNAIINSIIFYRYFSPVKPFIIHAFNSIAYPTINDPNTELVISTKISQILKNLQKTPISYKLIIEFNTRIIKKTWFTTNEESVCWERWIVTVETFSSLGLSFEKVLDKLKIDLRDTLLKIIDLVDYNKDHIPLISKTDSNPFPFEISIDPLIEI
ncbi:hypothetical protein BB561_003699 [Smittium simulii]|uniref:Autophagy-related protein 101 n=1 Tax=Smittium simulii TaxID=133385 RepID=A0A2T9YJZ7_9FUNG|nr:hypothetical protein BB561_003699 [Smittium simulii]